MYNFSEPDVNQIELFEQSLPFGGKLNRTNRWILLAELIDWRELDATYAKTFSITGRPGIRARYVLGSLIIKHIIDSSDEEAAEHISENPYMQYFIGLPRFSYRLPFDTSTFSKVRKRLGKEQFDEFEQNLINTLVEKKLLRPKGLLTDATVFQSDITFPTDCGLLNKIRHVCVEQIRTLSKAVGCKVRTYRRVAQKAYVAFSKKRRKTHKEVRQMQKQLLQYVRRNIRQLSELSELIEEVADAGVAVTEKVVATLQTVKELYAQQKQMYDSKKKSVENRIVSFHKPYIRPIVRGKDGKGTEFGAKVSLSHVDGYLFADYISFDNYHEGKKFIDSVELFEKRFGKKPNYVAMDQAYGSKENRNYLKEHTIRAAVKPLGRPKKNNANDTETRWRKRKQKERNRIEGAIGNSKNKYSLGVIRAKSEITEYAWIRFALMSRNIAIAGKRIL